MPLRRRLAVSIVLALAGCGSDVGGDAPAVTSSDLVDEVDADDAAEAAADAEADARELGPDPEPMEADDEVEAAAERPDVIQDDEAEAELADVAELEAASITKAPPRCKKRIHVTFAVYTSLPKDLGGNGCWVADRTVQDADFRDCHSDGSIVHASGTKWFYDDTNPRNALATERARIRACSGDRPGFEYMAFRDGAWRFVGRPHALAYFAELYTDDAHIDDLWYQPAVYRTNARLRRHRRVAPMLNFAPWPDGRYSLHQIDHEVLKVCKTVRNHGYLGLYEWHYPLHDGSPRLARLVHVLDVCTRKKT